MSFIVVRKGWGRHRTVSTHETREEADRECKLWNDAETDAFNEGRVVYDVAEYEVQEVRT